MTHDISEPDPAAAFENLRREISLTRAAVEGLTAARERVPDYGPTLAAVVDGLKKTHAIAARIEASPAIQLPPAAMAGEMAKASEIARHADAVLLRQAAGDLQRSCAQIDLMIKRGQATDRQHALMIWCVVGGMVLGIVLFQLLLLPLMRSLLG